MTLGFIWESGSNNMDNMPTTGYRNTRNYYNDAPGQTILSGHFVWVSQAVRSWRYYIHEGLGYLLLSSSYEWLFFAACVNIKLIVW